MTAFTYRNAAPDDRAKVIDFINMVFSVAHQPHDFKVLLPKVFADGRGQDDIHRIALDEAGGIRGSISLLPGELRAGNTSLRTGYVGNVSTHPYGRGEGHMKRLMEMTIRDARDMGMDLLLLGGQRQRYGYFGFTPGGLRSVYTVNDSNVRHALSGVRDDGIAFLPMREAAEHLVDAAYALYAAQPFRMSRGREDFVVTLESWTRTPFVVLKDGAFAGYLVADGSGETLGELLLADTGDLPAVVKTWMRTRNLKEIAIPTALYDHPLNRALGAFAEEWQLQVTQKLLVLNFPQVLAVLLPLSAARRSLPDGVFSLWIDNKPLTIAVQSSAIAVTETGPEDAPRVTAMEAQALFFSPFAEGERLSLPAGWFPIPLFIPEADCF